MTTLPLDDFLDDELADAFNVISDWDGWDDDYLDDFDNDDDDYELDDDDEWYA